jgi:uncharacterized protein (TIGR03437 family)
LADLTRVSGRCSGWISRWAVLAGFAASPFLAFSQISIAHQSVPAGGIAVTAVTLAGNSSPAGLQFDLIYPADATLSATLSTPVVTAGKSLYQAAISPTQKRFLIVGMNLNGIPAGPVVNLSIAIAPAAAPGEGALKFANVAATGPDGSPIALSGQDGSISIGPAPSGSALSAWGVRNAASLDPGPIAPGEFVTLFGTLTAPIAREPFSSMTVTVNGIAAPLLYVGANQINAAVPFEVSGPAPAAIEVKYQNQILGSTSVPLAAAAPGIFAADGSGRGQAAVLNQSGTANSPADPADRGSIITIFATGAGQMNPPTATGQIVSASSASSPIIPVSVTIDGLDAPVSYVGAAPGLMAGVLQVNCQAPPGARTGPVIPILLQMAGFASQSGLTMAIK